ncbi:MAG: class I SAM-dependent DNA methyltransferase [Chloroflexi bacterium]|nr:class I SAM-dependent DNA methyltransferase [Chloroflexota bacterium]
MLPWNEIETRAIAFQRKWRTSPGTEKQDDIKFIQDFLHVFGVDWQTGFPQHQIILPSGKPNYIDYLLPGKILIEMKSRGESLEAAHTQAMNYVRGLKPEEIPRLIMVCDFYKIQIFNYDKKHPYKPFKITELRKHLRIFSRLAGFDADPEARTEIELNTDASYKMAKLHDALKESGYSGHELEVYLVRLLFCLFADDTGVFEKSAFYNYIKASSSDGNDLGGRLSMLFHTLNTPTENRMTTLHEELRRFRYINGALFAERLPMSFFSAKMRAILLECCDFDWTQISPAIFGAMFQGVKNPQERRELGAHYTSEENILKVIRPLFLDELQEEFERSKSTIAELKAFHRKLASLTFLDPACGCGNFLIVTYQKLRQLEFEVLKLLSESGQMVLFDDPTKVTVDQFFGIEIEDFPCEIAKVSMLLTKHLMDQEISHYFGGNFIDYPIRDNASISNANALRMGWNEVIPAHRLNYIMGNPPFNGARTMSTEQKSDLQHVFGDVKNVGNLDFVTPWYKKSADMMDINPDIQTALVSTNSIVQGDQAGILGEYMFGRDFEINFAYRTFRWSNAAKGKAAVHCVIIGFSKSGHSKQSKKIYNGNEENVVSQINQYLIDAPKIIIRSRSKPICDVPEIGIGNKPIDGGNYLFSKAEMDEFIEQEPGSVNYFRPWYGADEFINRRPRYCLYLKHAFPSDLKKMPLVMKRIENVRQFRLKSVSPGTVKLAETPTKFHVENEPTSTYLVLPETSSENRAYIPMGFLEPEALCSNAVRILPNATLFHFGILTSSTHMAWMRTVAGRLKSDYRYSKDIVYNNFPWPDPTPEQKVKIEQTARAILAARERYPKASLADLYDELTMPPDLRKAHQANDKAVWEAYAKPWHPLPSEPACVAYLMELYLALKMNEKMKLEDQNESGETL